LRHRCLEDCAEPVHPAALRRRCDGVGIPSVTLMDSIADSSSVMDLPVTDERRGVGACDHV
jgi:hypothetical protein